MDSFNQLTNGQAERLAILLEELGEAQQAIGKILRHGYESRNPFKPESPDNREHLERELGDVQYAIESLCIRGELNEQEIEHFKERKSATIKQYIHHNE